MVVVVAKGGCFRFFAVGYGCHGGAVVVLVCGFLVVSICVFFFFFPPVVVAGYKGWWPVTSVGGSGCEF